MGGKQLGFADYEQPTAKKRTKKEKFLAEMDQVAGLIQSVSMGLVVADAAPSPAAP